MGGPLKFSDSQEAKIPFPSDLILTFKDFWLGLLACQLSYHIYHISFYAKSKERICIQHETENSPLYENTSKKALYSR